MVGVTIFRNGVTVDIGVGVGSYQTANTIFSRTSSKVTNLGEKNNRRVS